MHAQSLVFPLTPAGNPWTIHIHLVAPTECRTSKTHTNAKFSPINNFAAFYWLSLLEPSSQIYRTCLETAWRMFSAPKKVEKEEA